MRMSRESNFETNPLPLRAFVDSACANGCRTVERQTRQGPQNNCAPGVCVSQTPGANPRVMSAASALLVRLVRLHCMNSASSAAISEIRGFAARSTQHYVHYFSNNKKPALHIDKSKFRSTSNSLNRGLAEIDLSPGRGLETTVSGLSLSARNSMD